MNGDGKLDLVTITYQEHNLRVFRQDDPHACVTVVDTTLRNLHEGMDVGSSTGTAMQTSSGSPPTTPAHSGSWPTSSDRFAYK